MIIKYVLAVFLVFSMQQTFCQSRDFTINYNFKSAPSSVSKSPLKLAEYLTSKDSSDFQKSVNIYTWIIHNIKYDVKASQKIKTKSYTPQQTLRRKKGICYQYSELFKVLCQNANISTKEIVGYSRGVTFHEEDLLYDDDHSWNGIKLDSAWYLVDATWGSGELVLQKKWLQELLFKIFNKPYINDKFKFVSKPNYNYFLTKPENLIEDHLPSDPTWQLINHPISIKTFESNKWKGDVSSPDSSYQSVIDSLSYLSRLDKYEFMSYLQYFERLGQLSEEYNPRNSYLSGYYAYLLGNSLLNSLPSNTDAWLKSANHAKKQFIRAATLLERHKKSSKVTANKTIAVVNRKVSEELIIPLRRRNKACVRDSKEAFKLLDNAENQIIKYNKAINQNKDVLNRVQRPLLINQKSKKEQPELLAKSEKKLQSALEQVTLLQDSLNSLISGLKKQNEQKQIIQNEIIVKYRKLPTFLLINQNAIIFNQQLSVISHPVANLDSIGIIIDSLIVNRNIYSRDIKLRKSQLAQVQTTIISLLKEIQAIVIAICQYSQHVDCKENIYNDANDRIKNVYQSRIELQKMYLEMLKVDSENRNELLSIVLKLNKSIPQNIRFVELFQERRLGGIGFNLNKSYYKCNNIINECKKSNQAIASEIIKLRKKIKSSR